MRALRQRLFRPACLLGMGLVLLGGSGCQVYRNLGTGEHYDAPPPPPVTEKSTRVREFLIQVTTDAKGVVTEIQFKRSSGSPDLDNYVAESLRSDWPGAPAKRTVVSLTYSGLNGFSQPKVLSTEPAP